MSRPSRSRAAALALVLAVVLGACSHTRQIPDSYGSTTEDNFIEGCVEAMTSTSSDVPGERVSDEEAEAVCTCSYEAISDEQDGIPFDEFKEINAEQEEDPTDLPAPIADRVESCRGELS